MQLGKLYFPFGFLGLPTNQLLPAVCSTMSSPKKCFFVERSFTCRFRCLLDKSSGFLVRQPRTGTPLCPQHVLQGWEQQPAPITLFASHPYFLIPSKALHFRGRLKFLLGQQKALDRSPLALFAIATPLQPLSILELQIKTLRFQAKFKLDFTPTANDFW